MLDRSIFPQNEKITRQLEKFRGKIEFETERKAKERKTFIFS